MVPHQRLISKLRSVLFVDMALKLLSSFILNRSQHVRIYYSILDLVPVLRGVTQGSVLGPLLLIIFVAALPRLASPGSNIYQFADDLKLMRKIRDDSDVFALQKDIYEIMNWFSKWLSLC